MKVNTSNQHRAARSLLRVTTLAAAIGIGLVGQAHAQSAPKGDEPAASAKSEATTLERVAVTGSQIKGVDMESAVPLVSVSRAEIDRMGVTSVDDVLRILAVVGEGAGRMSNSSHNSYANLRNIGTNRTLVLVNGHRWVGSSDLGGAVNLNSIPLGIVERVDVLKDGGSVLYGADAMVGLVNIVLKDNYDGVEGRVRYGSYEQGGGTEREVQVTAGHTGERFSGVVAFQSSKGDPILNTDYKITAVPPPYGSPPSLTWSNATPAGRFQLCRGNVNAAGVCPTASLGDPAGGRNFFTYDPGQTGKNWRNYNLDSDPFNDRQYRDLLTPYDRQSVVGSMKYTINDHMYFKMFGEYLSERMERPLPPAVFDLGTSANPIVIPRNNFYNPFGVPIGRVQRSAVEGGGREFSSRARTRTISSALGGDFELAGRNFDWEVGFMAGSTYQRAQNQNEFSLAKLRNALGPSFKDPGGNVVCGTPGKVIAGCVPLNLLGVGAITPEMLDYLRLDPESGFTNYFRDNDYWAQFSTPNLFRLPAGDVGLAGGFERHIVYGAFNPSESLRKGDVMGSPTRNYTAGGYGVREAYGEFYVPVLKDIPLIKQLDFSLAGRYSRYDSGVSTFNKKWGVKWKITDDLALRGSYSTGFRYDLGGILQNDMVGTTTLGGGTFDPCTFTTGTNGAITANRYAQLSPELQAKCRGFGVPAGGYDSRLAGSVTTQRNANPNLQPEKDVFRTVGILYSPRFIQGLDLSVDYWAVRFRDSIVLPTVQDMLENCLANYGDSHVCPENSVQRDANGAVTYVRNAALNSNGTGERYSGYDVRAIYRLKTESWGNFRFDWNSAYLASFQQSAVPPFQNLVGTYSASSFPTRPSFRLRSNLTVGWDRGRWGAQWTARYYSGLKEPCRFVGTSAVELCNDLGEVQFRDPNGNVANNKYLPFLHGGSANYLSAYTLHDVNASYKTTWLGGGRISGGVRNVFNKQPSVSMSAGQSGAGIGYSPSFGIPDRFFYLEYSQKF